MHAQDQTAELKGQVLLGANAKYAGTVQPAQSLVATFNLQRLTFFLLFGDFTP